MLDLRIVDGQGFVGNVAIGTLLPATSHRHLIREQPEHLEMCRSKPVTSILASLITSINRISAPQAKHLIAPPLSAYRATDGVILSSVVNDLSTGWRA